MEEKDFLVSATSFELYTAFKNECEKIGWEYNHNFTGFNIKNSVDFDGLFFSTHWDDDDKYSPKFSLSNSGRPNLISFNLDYEWNRALTHVITIFDNSKKAYEDTLKSKENTWGTFYGKKFKLSEMSHQHLSNIVHYYKYVCNTHLGTRDIINEEITKRFGGILLPYHPLISFVSEIDYLKQEGYTTGEPNADIIVKGKWIGKILYN